MKIRFLTSLAGKGFVYGAGQEKDLPPAEAKDWIGQGLAVAVKEEKKPAQRPVKVQEVKAETRPVRKKRASK